MIVLYIAILIIFLILTVLNLAFLPRLKAAPPSNSFVSLLIPMRNEERNVESLIRNLKCLTHRSLEVIILDDGSTDQTSELLRKSIGEDPFFKVIAGKPLPEGWVGKVHACHQLSVEAKGEYLFFLDADVRIAPDTIEKVLAEMDRRRSGLITGFPRFPVKPLLGKLLVPFQHFLVFFHLPLVMANYTTFPAFTAAHGAFMFFKRDAYESIGGHQAVRSSLLEDVHITRLVKKKGWKATLINNTEDAVCHMYDTNREVWEGFLKNIYIGLGQNPFMVGVSSLFYFAFYFLPLPLFGYGIISFQEIYCLPLIVVWAQTFIIDRTSNQSSHHFWLMPLASLALIAIMWASMLKRIRKQTYKWKGRSY